MARRGGKAASRRSRQRRTQRAPQAPQPQSTPQPALPEEAPEPTMAPATTDAFEAADAELRASTAPPGSRAVDMRGRGQSVRQRTSDFFMASGPSRLGERAAAEYHYVARDLRNIGVLVLVMVVLLAVAAVLVNLLGIGRA